MTQRTHVKGWKALWHFLVDTAITNDYKLAHCTEVRPWGESWESFTHKRFRRQLATELFKHSERLNEHLIGQCKPLTYYVIHTDSARHKLITMKKSLACKARFCAERKAVNSGMSKRKTLRELSINVQRGDEAVHKRRDGYRRSGHGCDVCKIYICRNGPCWSEDVETIYGGWTTQPYEQHHQPMGY